MVLKMGKDLSVRDSRGPPAMLTVPVVGAAWAESNIMRNIWAFNAVSNTVQNIAVGQPCICGVESTGGRYREERTILKCELASLELRVGLQNLERSTVRRVY